MAGETLTVGRRKVPVSNLDKVLYPAAKFTKAALIDYYIRASRFLLPHLEDRPLTLKRYPDGVAGEFFYEKDAPSFTPSWVRTVPVPRRGGGPDIRYVVIDDLPSLVWAANLANIELHPFLHRADHLDQPGSVVFDLDPGEGASILECCELALSLKTVLGGMQLQSLPKVSGSKGLQVYVPLNSSATYAATQPFAKKIAQLLEREHPKLAVSEMSKSLRTGKVFIDWSQNSDFKTTVGVYSMRAKRTTPFISMPVTWDEIESALAAKDSNSLYWHPPEALARLEQIGDLFSPLLKLKQSLPNSVSFSSSGVSFSSRGASAPPLETYRAKRNFSKTSEPTPKPRRSRQGGRRRFVIQKHAASHLHYDFRLEMHDVLKSWAVPKGVPYQPGQRRLAMATEDHPIEYLDFEGTIPKGQYGGGTVMVWDIGTYDLIEGNYYKGSLTFHLDGHKLKGEWKLTRDPNKSDNAWTLEKSGEAVDPAPEDMSAVSGRTMKQIASAGDRVWQSNRALPDTTDLPQAKLAFVEPMRAKLVHELPAGAGWQFEIKLDGYRALLIRSETESQLLSRNNNSLAGRFKQIVRACQPVAPGTILDGEVVALDGEGRPSFNLLQNWQTSQHPIVYYVFDLLAYKGKSVLKLPLTERRALLSEAMNGVAEPVRLLGTVEAPTADLIEAARKQGLEGFVAKRASSIYEPGLRSGSWVKYKVNQGQELVIGGYMPGSKHHFESILVGYYEGDRLMFMGKVRNGFVPESREAVFRKFKGLGATKCPFANLPEPRSARRGEALTAEVMKKCCWLKPVLVAQIEYTDWTEANHLRHSRFAGLREDKPAREVIHEGGSEQRS